MFIVLKPDARMDKDDRESKKRKVDWSTGSSLPLLQDARMKMK